MPISDMNNDDYDRGWMAAKDLREDKDEQRIAELEAIARRLQIEGMRHFTEKVKLELRIDKAKKLAGHKSLDSRRELLAILEGDDETTD